MLSKEYGKETRNRSWDSRGSHKNSLIIYWKHIKMGYTSSSSKIKILNEHFVNKIKNGLNL